jgi:ubiquinone/menaquinone biosynthesis C-methylase UbiE
MNRINKRSKNEHGELSTDLSAYYSQAYSNIASSGAFGLASKIQHRQLEKFTSTGSGSKGKFLEVGAGQGQHIDFVDPQSWSEYIQTDLRPPEIINPGKGKWITTPVDAANLPFEDESFDRLIATCVLAHTDDPAVTLKEWRRVIRPGGVISIYIPTESSLALTLARHLGPKKARVRAGFDPTIIFLDHRYNYRYLRTVVDIEFSQNAREIHRFPRFLPWWMSLWEIIQVRL